MRASILIARVRGEDAWEFICGPDVPMHEQRAMFKEAKVEAKHPRWDRIELWERPSNADFVKLAEVPLSESPVQQFQEPVLVAPVIPAGISVPPGTVVTEAVTQASNPAGGDGAQSNPEPVTPADEAAPVEPDPIVGGDSSEDFAMPKNAGKGKAGKGSK